MNENENSPVFDEARKRLADFVVGFAALANTARGETARCAGSGTLVSIGSVHGILTAAHLLNSLPDQGKVGLIRFPTFGARSQAMKVDMAHVKKILIGPSRSPSKGPDIGFLKLPLDTVGSLKAHNTFFNLRKREDLVFSRMHSRKPYFDCVTGVVHERTKEVPAVLPNTRLINFEASVEPGNLRLVGTHEGYDLFKFRPQIDEEPERPVNYAGMSGGALWRVFCRKNSKNELEVAEVCLAGVVFYQSRVTKNRRTLRGHGRKSVYRKLLKKICEA